MGLLYLLRGGAVGRGRSGCVKQASYRIITKNASMYFSVNTTGHMVTTILYLLFI